MSKNVGSKSGVGQKRTHAQLVAAQENLQTQILNTVTRTSARTTTTKRPIESRTKAALQGAFKQPLPKVSRQRQETHDPAVQPQEGEDKEMTEWRKQIKRFISHATFYFDGMEETSKEQAVRWIVKYGGVVPNQGYD
jgi:hypothetical protein